MQYDKKVKMRIIENMTKKKKNREREKKLELVILSIYIFHIFLVHIRKFYFEGH